MTSRTPARRWRAVRPIAAVALGCGALVAAVLPVVGAVSAAPAGAGVCTPVTHPLGPATGFTEFIEGWAVRTSSAYGANAYGGDLTASVELGGSLPVLDKATPTLVVGGAVKNGPVKLKQGSAYVPARQGVEFHGGGDYLAASPIDFTEAFTALRGLSQVWAAATATGTTTVGQVNGQPAVHLHGTDPDLNVFSVQAADLAQNRNIHVETPRGSATYVNVLGSHVTITGQLWFRQDGRSDQASDGTMAGREKLLWNFPDATSVTMSYGGMWAGVVFAPNAAVRTVNAGGYQIGQTVARSLDSDRQTHLPVFGSPACVPVPPTPPSETPTPTPTPTESPTESPSEDPTETPSESPTESPTETPTGTPDPPGRSDVTVTKSASRTEVRGGEQLTYTLLVRNVGAADATGVVVRDELPSGVTLESASPGCASSGRTVTCDVGTLAPGAGATLDLVVVADPIAGAGAPEDKWDLHELTPYKVEQHVDLEPGQVRQLVATCGTEDAIASDASLRVDHVDQGTGTLRDVEVRRVWSAGRAGYEVEVRNHAAGRAQAKLFLVCLPGATEATDGHRHRLQVDPAPVTAAETLPAGRATVAVACPAGTRPIAPAYQLAGGSATLVGSEDEGPRGRAFTFDVTEPTTATVAARCLRTEVAAADGHVHALRLDHEVRTVTVPADSVVEEQVICADDAKGVVATWSLPPGVHPLGHDPRLKARAFRLWNTTGSSQQATVDLECLADRTGHEQRGHSVPVVVENVAVVGSTSPDADPTNNASAVSITVRPGAATTVPTGTRMVGGNRVRLAVVSSMPGTGKVAVRKGGRTLAKGRVRLVPGGVRTATLRLTGRPPAAGARVTVVVDPQRGPTTRRVVVLERR